jgi:competence protein ComFC
MAAQELVDVFQYRAYRLAWAGVDWLFPPACGGCGRKGARWCESCRGMVKKVEPPVCEFCGQRIRQPGICPRCHVHPPAFEALRVACVYEGPIRKAHHRLKYNYDISLADSLAELLLELYRSLDWGCDMIIPVPLGKERLKERGFNQAAVLAYPLALGSRVAYRSEGLERVRETASQVGLTVDQRRQNVAGAFTARPEMVKDRRVVIVDDVITTGATMDACAAALRQAGAERVYGLALARPTFEN